MKKSLPLLSVLLAFSPGALPLLAATSDEQAVIQAQHLLDAARQRYPDGHPQIENLKLHIKQIQSRFDVEARENRETRQPVIRTTLKIQSAKADGQDAELLASPTLVTQAGQEASIRVGDLSVVLASSADDQNNITTVIELTQSAPDKAANKLTFPLLTSRPGEPASVRVGGFAIDVVANLLEPKGIDVDFPGGSLGQLLASLNTAGSRSFNLIAAQDVLALPLPAFKLRNVEPRDLALAIDWLLDGYIVDIPADNPERAGLPVFTVRVNNKASPASQTAQPAKPERFESCPVSVLKNQFPIEEVVATLHAAWALDPSHRPEDLRIKYHAPTGILLVSSREEAALDVLNRVMTSLVTEAGHRQSRTP